MKKQSDSRVPLPPSGIESSSSVSAARYLGNKVGLTAEQLLQRDLEAMRRRPARSIDCVHVTDLEDLENGAVSESLIEHATTCDTCSAFLDLAKPGSQQEEDFARAVREQDALLRIIGNAAARR
jgi:hypothetical protein